MTQITIFYFTGYDWSAIEIANLNAKNLPVACPGAGLKSALENSQFGELLVLRQQQTND